MHVGGLSTQFLTIVKSEQDRANGRDRPAPAPARVARQITAARMQPVSCGAIDTIGTWRAFKESTMRNAVALSILILPLVLAGPASAQMQGNPPASQRYCLLESGTGAMDCGFATLEQCRQTSNVGREGTCIQNPAATTGSGTRDSDMTKERK
jgi:hypothetical protein